jgi:outer membrane receptor protein involved in Fe transport
MDVCVAYRCPLKNRRPWKKRALGIASHTFFKALWVGATCAAALAGLSAQAADTASSEATSAAPVEEIVITGSRIPVPANITSTSPIQVVTSQEFELSGTTDTTTMINRLPQISVNAAADLGNNQNPLSHAGGIATADLRGLGPQRTLVLVDGRRLGPGDPNTANTNVSPDLDQVPAALIERVDVVTGGASAVYGSDAIAGVVNFIMKKNFEGVEVDGQYGFFQHHNDEAWAQQAEAANGFAPAPGNVTDGRSRDLSVIMGTNMADGAGNVTAFFTYHTQDPVLGASRDFANCELVTNAANNGLDCIGSANSNQFVVGSTPYTVVGNQLLPWPQAGSSPPAKFDSFSTEYLQRQDERYNAGFYSHLDLNDWAKPYLEFSFMNDKTTEVGSPSGLFEGSNPATADNRYLVNCSNPLLSAQELSILCGGSAAGNADIDIGRRNIEGGGRLSYYEHTNYRVVGGVKGDLATAWTYDAYGQFAYTSLFNANENYLNYASINNALQVTGTAANPVCVSGGSCVPYNIFTQGGVTAAQLAYLSTPGTAYGQNWEEIAHADVTGDLGKYNITSPWAKDGVAVNVGVEHRFEALNYAPDSTELSGDLSGYSGASVAIDQGYAVNEGFVEFRAPLAQNKPGVHDLSVDVGYRDSSYSTAGTTNTYKFAVQYAPTEDVGLRYSYDRAVRAPNLIELYNPQSYSSQGVVGVDPCAPTIGAGGIITAAATASLAQCQHTGVTATQYGNGNVAGAVYTGTIPQCVANQCGQVSGGNPHLKPETADTYSIGITMTPTYLPNFSGSIDYYHIAISNEVTTVPASYLFNQCLLEGTGSDCSQIVRNPVTGSLSGATVAGGGYILQTNINAGASLVSGIDVQANYRFPISGGWGALSANFNGTWLQHNTTTPYPGAHTYDCAGLFGETCQTVSPTWRHNLRLNWETPWSKLLLSANWRFIGGTALDNNSSDPSLQFVEEGGYDSINAHLPSYSYLDLSAKWPIWSGIELRGGINNVLDKDPPIIPFDLNQGSIPNSYPTYDYMGRQIYLAFKAKF